jgi:3-deoxy-manno-octulosonate cytidylyltransferase (CMP-KDO synthetase)
MGPYQTIPKARASGGLRSRVAARPDRPQYAAFGCDHEPHDLHTNQALLAWRCDGRAAGAREISAPMKFAIIVPVRLASTRLHQKMLYKVMEKPVILWTAERIRSEAPEFPLFFAVDGEILQELLTDAGFQTIMTDPAHACGTDRIAEANRTLGAEYVINVQGDEPVVTGNQIRQLATMIAGDVPMATLGTPLRREANYLDPHHVKLVCDINGHAISFSRAPIPYFRDTQGIFDAKAAARCPVLIHLGLYAYRGDFLEAFSKMPPGKLEDIEKLEMLRVLERGYRIAVGVSNDKLIQINTLQQALEFEQFVKERLPSPSL